MAAKDYIRWIRSKVGHEKIILTFAGGCIYNNQGEVLLQRRGDSNKWGFPGGAIEPGETPEMTAIREAKEETGLDVSVRRLIGVYTDPDITYSNGDQAQSIIIAYELRTVGGKLFCSTMKRCSGNISGSITITVKPVLVPARVYHRLIIPSG